MPQDRWDKIAAEAIKPKPKPAKPGAPGLAIAQGAVATVRKAMSAGEKAARRQDAAKRAMAKDLYDAMLSDKSDEAAAAKARYEESYRPEGADAQIRALAGTKTQRGRQLASQGQTHLDPRTWEDFKGEAAEGLQRTGELVGTGFSRMAAEATDKWGQMLYGAPKGWFTDNPDAVKDQAAVINAGQYFIPGVNLGMLGGQAMSAAGMTIEKGPAKAAKEIGGAVLQSMNPFESGISPTERGVRSFFLVSGVGGLLRGKARIEEAHLTRRLKKEYGFTAEQSRQVIELAKAAAANASRAKGGSAQVAADSLTQQFQPRKKAATVRAVADIANEAGVFRKAPPKGYIVVDGQVKKQTADTGATEAAEAAPGSAPALERYTMGTRSYGAAADPETGILIKPEGAPATPAPAAAPTADPDSGVLVRPNVEPGLGGDTRIQVMPLSRIGVNPKLQYKDSEVVDKENNVSGQFKGINVYDQAKGGVWSVWQDVDGNVFAGNSHHRRELANRAERFVDSSIRPGELVDVPRDITVRVLDEKDGWTLEKAKAHFALENIAQGKGTAFDAVNVLKEAGFTEGNWREHFLGLGIDINSRLSRNIEGLINLPDEGLTYVRNNALPEEVVAGIGSVDGLTNDERLVVLDSAYAKAREGKGPETFNKGVEMARLARGKFMRKEAVSNDDGGGLFDDDDAFSLSLKNLDVEADIKAGLKRKIERERSDLLRMPSELLEGESLKIDERNRRAGKLGKSNQQAKDRVDFVYDHDGPLAAMLETAAQEVVNGRINLSEAVDRLYNPTVQKAGGDLESYLRTGQRSDSGVPRKVAEPTGPLGVRESSKLPGEVKPPYQPDLPWIHDGLSPAAREYAEQHPMDVSRETIEIDNPERVAMRNRMLDEAYQAVEPNRRSDREIVILLGGSGSGKSTVARANHLRPEDGALLIDPDEFKNMMPEKFHVPDGNWVALTHEEGSTLSKELMLMGMQNGDNLVWPTLGSNPEKLRGMIDRLHGRGYRVTVGLVDVPVEVALERVAKREAGGGHGVPEEVARASNIAAREMFGTIQKEGLADETILYDANRPEGEPAVVVDRRIQSPSRRGGSPESEVGSVRRRDVGDGHGGADGPDPSRGSEDLASSVGEPRAKYATRPDSGPEQYTLALDLLAGLNRRTGSLLAQSIAKTVASRGGAELVGQTVRNSEDLATLAQILRDPRWETFRWFWMRGNEIVGHSGFSLRAPGAAVTFKPEKDGSFDDGAAMIDWAKQQMAGHGADGYWLLHNHPSGRVHPSPEDRNSTIGISQGLPGFRGHVIINHNKYSGIDAAGNSTRDIPLKGFDTPDPLLENPAVPHETLGYEINGASDFAWVAKKLQMAKDQAILIGTDPRLFVRAALEIPWSTILKAATDPKEMAAIIRKFKRETGSSAAGLVLPETSEAMNFALDHGKLIEGAIKSDLLVDVLYPSGRQALYAMGRTAEPGMINGRTFGSGIREVAEPKKAPAADEASELEELSRRGSMLANRLASDIRRQSSAVLIGSEIKSDLDLAAAGQVFRDPRYETLRWFWMKGNTIVGATGFSSRAVGAATGFVPHDGFGDVETWAKAQMQSHGADGYWLLHNHPYGEIVPSEADLSTTQRFAKTIPGLRGHVIINHNKYASMDRSGNLDGVKEKLPAWKPMQPDPLKPGHPFLNQPVYKPGDMVALAKANELLKDKALLMGKNGATLNGISEVPWSYIAKARKGVSLNMAALVRKFGRDTGSTEVHLLLPFDSGTKLSSADMDLLHKALETRLIEGVYYANGGSPAVATWHDRGMAHGRSLDETAMVVREGGRSMNPAADDLFGDVPEDLELTPGKGRESKWAAKIPAERMIELNDRYKAAVARSDDPRLTRDRFLARLTPNEKAALEHDFNLTNVPYSASTIRLARQNPPKAEPVVDDIGPQLSFLETGDQKGQFALFEGRKKYDPFQLPAETPPIGELVKNRTRTVGWRGKTRQFNDDLEAGIYDNLENAARAEARELHKQLADARDPVEKARISDLIAINARNRMEDKDEFWEWSDRRAAGDLPDQRIASGIDEDLDAKFARAASRPDVSPGFRTTYQQRKAQSAADRAESRAPKAEEPEEAPAAAEAPAVDDGPLRVPDHLGGKPQAKGVRRSFGRWLHSALLTTDEPAVHATKQLGKKLGKKLEGTELDLRSAFNQQSRLGNKIDDMVLNGIKLAGARASMGIPELIEGLRKDGLDPDTWMAYRQALRENELASRGGIDKRRLAENGRFLGQYYRSVDPEKLAKWDAEWMKLADAHLDLQEYYGLRPEGWAKKMREQNLFYFPMDRVALPEEATMRQLNPSSTASPAGENVPAIGGSDYVDGFAAMASKIETVIKNGELNQTVGPFLFEAAKHPDLSSLVTEVRPARRSGQRKDPTAEDYEEFEELFTNPAEDPFEGDSPRPRDLVEGADSLVEFYDQGKRRAFKIDPYLWDTMRGMQPRAFNVVQQVLRGAAAVARGGTTKHNPLFVFLFNPMIDVGSATTVHGLNPFRFFQGAWLASAGKKGAMYQRAIENNAFFTGAGHRDLIEAADKYGSMSRRVFDKKASALGIRVFHKAADFYKAAGKAIEEGTRMGFYAQREKAYLRKGMDSREAARRAAQDAADLFNFGESGALAKLLTENGTPYAAIVGQSLQSMKRGIKRNPLLFFLRGAALMTVPALLEQMLYQDDEEWKSFPDYIKYGAMTFREGAFRGKPDEGDWISFRIPYEMGVWFRGVPMIAMEEIEKGDDKDLAKAAASFRTTLADAYTPAFMPTAAALIFQQVFHEMGGGVVDARFGSMRSYPLDENASPEAHDRAEYRHVAQQADTLFGSLGRYTVKKGVYELDKDRPEDKRREKRDPSLMQRYRPTPDTKTAAQEAKRRSSDRKSRSRRQRGRKSD